MLQSSWESSASPHTGYTLVLQTWGHTHIYIYIHILLGYMFADKILCGSSVYVCKAQVAYVFALVVPFQTPQFPMPLPVTPHLRKGIGESHWPLCHPSSLGTQLFTKWTNARLSPNICSLQFKGRGAQKSCDVGHMICMMQASFQNDMNWNQSN